MNRRRTARRDRALHRLRAAEARLHQVRAWWGHDPRVRATHLAQARLAVVDARDALARAEVSS